ncbi:MAG: Coenzyme F420 hydrogenase/dehydrogenase, beta subunit C-terminal domain, partial [Smithellaceae bacterium]|nr:Coenzyme F420 hydrogenase/dehydrogenase, beta subunit C-terminal domain [Smithellaceae bacterium]
HEVIEQDLCTACGACAAHCPYIVSYQDRTVLLHGCDLPEGKCYACCPRTSLDLAGLRGSLFPDSPLTVELGPVRGYYLARAKEAKDRQGTQHGGVVTNLLSLALAAGIIDAAIVSERGDRMLSQGITVETAAEIRKRGGSTFMISPTLAEFNRLAREREERIGLVALPCQLQALAKMRHALAGTEKPLTGPSLTIGLFCGWALGRREFLGLLGSRTKIDEVIGMDIPPRQGLLEINVPAGPINIPLVDIQDAIRPACRFCIDTTAEFSDISAGAAGIPGDRSWNQVIVRSLRGEELFNLALKKGLIETRPRPEGSLEELKQVALEKKKTALANLAAKSGRPADLIYLDRHDPAILAIIGGTHDVQTAG